MSRRTDAPRVRIEPWKDADLELLRLTNTPEMTEHVGGPETEEQILARHQRYLTIDGRGQMFSVVLLPGEERVGSIGFWEREWQGETVYETGWGVLPPFQGRGIAAEAARAVIAAARAEHRHRSLHAYPTIGHAASNAVCRKAGFSLRGEYDFEYPPGHAIRSNDWCVDLTAPA